jgi:SAM-dependent methyltransferase
MEEGMGSMRPIGEAATRGVAQAHFHALPVDRSPVRRYSVYVPPALYDVPYVPTQDHIVTEMLRLADVGPSDVVYDLGCGDGRIVIAAASEFGASGVGIDIDPVRIGEAIANAQRAGVSARVRFRQASFFDADIREATVVALYLLPEINARLRPKLLADLRPGTRIVANHFDMGDWRPDDYVALGSRYVYRWIVPAWVSGRWRCVIDEPAGRRRMTLNLERRYQSVVGAARVGRDDLPIDAGRLKGASIRFRIGELHFMGTVAGDTMRGVARKGNGIPAGLWGAVRER